jgi:hypothetical protein
MCEEMKCVKRKCGDAFSFFAALVIRVVTVTVPLGNLTGPGVVAVVPVRHGISGLSA